MSRRLPDAALEWQGGWGRRNDSLLFVSDGMRWSNLLGIALGCLALGVVFWFVGGLPGILAAAVTVAVWYGLGAPFAIAAGVVTMGATGVETVSGGVLVALALAGIVLASAPVAPAPGRHVAVTAVLSAVLGGATVLAASVTALWLVATGILVSIGLAVFALHRYQLLVLGLLGEDDSPVPSPDGGAAVPADTPGGRSGPTADDRTERDDRIHERDLQERKRDEHAAGRRGDGR